MFDLDQAIAKWRQKLIAVGIKTPVPLEELEIHLREEIERQMKLGFNEEQAFEMAVQRLGKANTLNKEFQKANPLTAQRITSVVMGIWSVFIGLLSVWKVAVEGQSLGTTPINEFIGVFILSLILTSAIVLLGLVLIFCGGRNLSWLPNSRRKRKYV
jgi:hypothetical protein